ncbi:MAG: hypothetical protein U0174_14460 [Polyangiaceae bacterium]
MKAKGDRSLRTASPQPSLARVLRYRNHLVIDKFLERYRLRRREADVLFRDMLMLLWLGSRKRIHIFPPQILIDEMWHTFILHTQAYERFCHRFFGSMIHHLPTPSRPRARRRPVVAKLAVTHLRKSISAVYDELGRDVAERWYGAYRKRYTPSFLDACTRNETRRDGH